ncbi:MAG: arginine--tRNA ligase, partial [Candidatus Woesearchaeota archaeon]
MEYREHIASVLEKETKLGKEQILGCLEQPKDVSLGDYAFPCFALSKKFRKSPAEISSDLSLKIKPDRVIAKIESKGPYLNFFIAKGDFAESVLKSIFSQKGDYGKGPKKTDRVMVEYSQPNTHKAFHVGHLRGTSIGESLSRILKFSGYKVVQANYMGDTGAHVAKWLWCYMKFHKGERPPKENAEKWIASIYVEAVGKTTEDTQKEIDEVNYKLENNLDKELKKLWQESRKWSLDCFDLIYKELDAHFDALFFEGELDKRAKEISESLIAKKIVEVSDGATIIDLKKYNLGVWVLLRKDGTVLYSAKDLALAERKFTEFKIDKSIYVVGAAQSMHLSQLFKTLELMGFKNAEKCHHLSFLEVRLPTGKMSSRTGQNILYSDLKHELLGKLKEEVDKRHPDWDEKRKESSVQSIFSAAIKFDMLLQDYNRVIVFDIARAMDFEGET